MWLVGALVLLLALGFWVCWSWRPRRLARPAGSAADAAFRRHPAGRARWASADDLVSPGRPAAPAEWMAPRGPDDDPDFLAELDRVIRRDGYPEDGR
ncbi:MAG TPA: hypothetical protein VIP48_13785 [Streptosporangiaceae bacterium]